MTSLLAEPTPEAVEKKLPDLPAPVTGYPTPWLTKEETTKYFKALQGFGWYAEPAVYRVGPAPASARPLNLKVAALAKKYRFNKPQDADAFLKEVLEISAQEKVHHLLSNIHSALILFSVL